MSASSSSARNAKSEYLGNTSVKQCIAEYVGYTNVDSRVNKFVLPWIVAAIRRNPNVGKDVRISISAGSIRVAVLTDSSDVLCIHKINEVSNFTNYLKDRRYFFYFHKTIPKNPYVLHLFQVENEELVRDVYKDLQQSATSDLYKRSNSLHSGGSAPPRHLSSFEMRYQGHTVVRNRKGSAQLVDDWLKKEKDQTCARRLGVSARGAGLPPPPTDKVYQGRRRRSFDLSRSFDSASDFHLARVDERVRHDSNTSEGSLPEEPIEEEGSVSQGLARRGRARPISEGSSETSSTSDLSTVPSSPLSGAMGGSSSGEFSPLDGSALRGFHRRQNLIDESDRSRAVLLQIDSDQLSVISLDKKDVILDKAFSQIAYCTPGLKAIDHFGFICKDVQVVGQYVMYIFQCTSEEVVTEIMDTLKRAFAIIHQKNQETAMCELCPMKQLSQLCEELSEAKDAQGVNTIIQSKIVNLPPSDYSDLLTKVKTEECQSLEEANEVLMTKLRIICEIRQLEHSHTLDASNRLVPVTPAESGGSEFHLMNGSKQSKLDAIRNRAKKAFTFDMFKKKDMKKASRSSSIDSASDAPAITTSDLSLPSPPFSTPNGKAHPPHHSSLNNNINMAGDMDGGDHHGNGDVSLRHPADSLSPDGGKLHGSRPRAATIAGDQDRAPNFFQRIGQSFEALHHNSPSPSASSSEEKEKESKKSVSSLLSVGSNSSDALRKASAPPSSTPYSTLTPSSRAMSRFSRRSSGWRRGIFDKVVTPKARVDEESIISENESLTGGRVKRRLGSDELQALWRSAIEQTILLNRMERENQNLRAHQEETEKRRIQLDYEEITPCLVSVGARWTTLLGTEKGQVIEMEVLWRTARDGIPRTRRGEIWKLLAEQQALRQQTNTSEQTDRPIVAEEELSSAYHDLLEELTAHQHAILIDLGRTFPSHPYFKAQLGAGQLSLFNILKAYSLLDREVGYCQGLSFVAGILLMHTNEELAFNMLRHLMFTVGLREQYKPDMKALQIRMYQLSRLLHDRERAIYDHFEEHEITPTFYAAPWIITLFASQFPIGFVARVFDLLFLEGLPVLFKIALALLSSHRELILQCNTFESISDFLKTTLPSMGIVQMERIFSQVFALDIASDLHTYEAEYQVFQDDDEESRATVEERVAAAEQINAHLRAHNEELQETVHSQAAKIHGQADKIQMQETVVAALQQAYAKQKVHVKTLEMEKAALMKTIGKLKELIPGVVPAEKPQKRASVVPIVKISSPSSSENVAALARSVSDSETMATNTAPVVNGDREPALV